MSGLKSPFFWFVLALLTTAGLTALGPEDQALGSNVRIVYLHGAWVLTAEAVLAISAFAGLLGIFFSRDRPHQWSSALGRTGLFFWVADLPLSVWAMQANWNGLFMSEPRFRIAVIFAITGVVLQVGLTLLAKPAFTSLFNVLFFVALWIGLRQAGYILHPPPSPIFGSGIISLQLFFVGLILLTMIAAWFLSRWWLSR